MIDVKNLLELEDVEYSAGRKQAHGPVIILQTKDGRAQHPIGSYHPKTGKFKWDDGSLDEARQEELAGLVIQHYGK